MREIYKNKTVENENHKGTTSTTKRNANQRWLSLAKPMTWESKGEQLPDTAAWASLNLQLSCKRRLRDFPFNAVSQMWLHGTDVCEWDHGYPYQNGTYYHAKVNAFIALEFT